MMDYQMIWFILITVLFTGFFFLEGFDYGVGMLAPFVSKREEDRGLILRTIGPVWDGNEVWMITAGGALFAAFPHVYATMFSTFYLALFLMLVALILRGVAFELRTKEKCPCWQKTWDVAIFIGSIVPAFLWGVAVTDLAAGLPISANMVYQGNFLDLLSLYSILGGLVFVLVFAYHGAAFLQLRLVDKGLLYRVQDLGKFAGVCGAIAYVFYLLLTWENTDLLVRPAALGLFIATAVFFLASLYRFAKAPGKGSFILGALAVASVTIGFFTGMFPRLMVSSLNPDWSLTITNASSTEYTLSIMTVAALVLVPIVLVYQIWTYYIFRKRVTASDVSHY